MKKTVKQMYDFAREKNIALLSDFPADFWQPYLLDQAEYDAAFKRKFKNFVYFDQEGTEVIDDVVASFILDVRNHLLMNEKRYTELFRIESITNEEYSITENYNTTEEMKKNTVAGERKDINADNIGERTSENTTQVATYESETFNNSNKNTIKNMPAHDQTDFTKGRQEDSENYTFTKHGNIGVQTGSDLLEKHNDFWKYFTFYNMIFTEICAELLLVEGDDQDEYYNL